MNMRPLLARVLPIWAAGLTVGGCDSNNHGVAIDDGVLVDQGVALDLVGGGDLATVGDMAVPGGDLAQSCKGVLFQSNWTTALGMSDSAIRDTAALCGSWSEWNDGGDHLLSVVAGGPPGYGNALRVQQRGS